MDFKQESPVWPYLGILACLFVLSITAPRAWDRLARHETLNHALAVHRGRTDRAREKPAPASSKKLDAAERTLRNASPRKTEPIDQPVVTDAVDPPLHSSESPPESLVVPPAPEFAQQVREESEAADRPATPSTEPSGESSAEAPVDESALASSAWPLPRVLLEQLTRLAQEDPRAVWAQQAIGLIQQLCASGRENRRGTMDILAKLRASAERGAAAPAGGLASESRAARTRYALVRWLDIWESAAAWEQIRPTDGASHARLEQVRDDLANVETLMHSGPSGAAWQKYLQLESLHRVLAQPKPTAAELRAAARKVLDRLASSQLSRAQRKFVSAEPLTTLQTALRTWAAEPVTVCRLLAHLEQYERTGLASDARLVADDCRGLSWSSPAEAEQLSERLDSHYRNANLRIAVSGALLNRMVPQPKKIEAPVHDTVVNVPVNGRSTTLAKLSVRLVPDPRRIRVGLEANGLVASDTVSTSGPATFYNEGQSTFLVRKLLVLGPQGLSVWPAIAEAENNYSYLVSLETDFDGVPLVGSLVRSIARSQHENAQDEARVEVEQKVAVRAREQLDAEVRPHLVKAAESIQKKQAATLNRLGLELAPVGFSTTEERIVARVRLAAPEQLGAHTSRPRAPSDSWFSLQVHQSALNNGLDQLDLAGRKFSLPELFSWIAKKLDRPGLAELDDLPDGVHVTFARQDPVRVRCEADHLEVTFALAELTQGRKHWRDFTVHALYRPEPQRLVPSLVRDGAISLDGRSLKGKPEPLLRAIFSKVLSRHRDLSLLSETITSDPRVADLEITQFAIDDGWIALAYSPRRAPSNMARRPKP
jgi:hypothetical protein